MKKTAMLRSIVLSLLLVLVCIQLGWAEDISQHRIRRERPIEMGVTGGNVNNRTVFSCCSGTLGALLYTKDGPAVLSNNHIIGRNFDGSIGEDVSQPGIIDTACRAGAADIIGQVSALVPVDFTGGNNMMDAALAAVAPDVVQEDGFILEIGTPSSVPIDAALGMRVKKSGRTTGLTFGTVSSINVTTNVRATPPCGVVDGISRYVNQIAITPGSFIAGGDSGSLVVEDADECPGVVGLIFAGGTTAGIANPIAPILDAFGATLAGCPADASASNARDGFTKDHPAVAAVMAVQKKYENVMDIPGVVGTGVGLSEDGRPVLEIYLDRMDEALKAAFPKALDGVEVKLVESGPFEFL